MFGKYFDKIRKHFGYGKGSSPSAKIIANEYGIAGAIQRTELKFVNFPVVVGNTTGASFGNGKIYTFPQGQIQIIGGRANFGFNWAGQSIVATGSGDFSIGTTATADATLGGTDVNILASTAMLDPFVAGVGNGKGNLVTNTSFDGTAAAIAAFLNIIIDDADVADASTATVLVNGTIVISWINHGV